MFNRVYSYSHASYWRVFAIFRHKGPAYGARYNDSIIPTARNAVNLTKAQALCRSLPGATEDVKWEATLVYSVGNKMFAATSTEKNATHLSLKVDDDLFLGLTGRAGIIPAPYLARAKWIRIENIQTMSDTELTELIQRAHAIILNKLTKKLQREILGGK